MSTKLVTGRKAFEGQWHIERYYFQPPEKKTLEQCESHGSDHKAYGWSPQLDPRWSEEQKAAYWRGWDNQGVGGHAQ